MLIEPSYKLKGNLIERNEKRIEEINKLKGTDKLHCTIKKINDSLNSDDKCIFEDCLHNLFLEEIRDDIVHTYFDRLKKIDKLTDKFIENYNNHAHKGLCYTLRKVWRA